jgi:ferredoxin
VRVTVDLTKCNGYANCLMEAPGVFDLDDATGLVKLLQEQPADAELARVQAAARTCPVQAITVTLGDEG